jgi:Rod binding domain-containing protein
MASVNSLGVGALPASTSFSSLVAMDPAARKGAMAKEKARGVAEDFEAMFLNQMFSSMMTGMDGDGPFGGDKATGVWRSFLTNEYAKNFAKAGGVGLAKHVYSALIAQQEARQK